MSSTKVELNKSNSTVHFFGPPVYFTAGLTVAAVALGIIGGALCMTYHFQAGAYALFGFSAAAVVIGAPSTLLAGIHSILNQQQKINACQQKTIQRNQANLDEISKYISALKQTEKLV